MKNKNMWIVGILAAVGAVWFFRQQRIKAAIETATAADPNKITIAPDAPPVMETATAYTPQWNDYGELIIPPGETYASLKAKYPHLNL